MQVRVLPRMLFLAGTKVQPPGVEPGPLAWKARILTVRPRLPWAGAQLLPPPGMISVDDSPMAQSVARQAVNLQVAGSNPAGGDFARCCLQVSGMSQSIAVSAVVQWLGYLAFTQETRVQTPAAE